MDRSGSMDKEGGFTLLEMLIALTILGVGLASFYHVFDDSTHATTTARKHRHAVAAIANLLAEVGRSRPLAIGIVTGKLPDGQRWTLDIQAAGNFQPAISQSSIASYVVEVAVGDDSQARSHDVAVRTLLLGPVQ